MDARKVLDENFKTNRSCPSIKKEKGEMSIIPYSSIVGSLIYVMVYTCTNISHAVRVVSILLEKPNKTH